MSAARLGSVLVVGTWALAIAGGFVALARYKSTPAPIAASPPDHWPGASRIQRSASRPTLVVFIHPRCSCSRATLVELNKLAQRERDRVDTRVVLVGDDASDSEYARRAARIPGAVVSSDTAGHEARLFAASSSGHALLFGSGGELWFSGGLTASRGHEGESLGQARIERLLAGRVPDRPDAPVFGCELHDPGTSRAQESMGGSS